MSKLQLCAAGTYNDAVGFSCSTGPLPHWYDPLVLQLIQDFTGLQLDACKTDKRKNFAYVTVSFFFFFTDFYVGHINSPSCLVWSNTLVKLGGFLGTSPGNAGISPSSITTPLSAVAFETAESPRPSSLLPVSSYQSHSINTAAVDNV